VIPLYGFVEGDTLGLLVLAEDDDTIAEVAAKLVRSASVRVRPRPGLVVYHGGRALDGERTVAATGLSALDRIDVRMPAPEPEDRT